MFPGAAGQKFSVAGDFSRVSHRGKFGSCPVCRSPGLRPPPKSSSKGRMEALNLKPEARAQSASTQSRSSERGRDDFRPWRKRQSGASAITMRLGWLARAAFVFAGHRPRAGRVRSPRPSTHSREIKFGLVRSGPAPATAHPGSRDHPGLVLVPASVWVRGRGRAAADAMDRSARADTTRARNANLIWQTL